MIKFDVLTIFPRIFDSYLNESILKRAREKKLIEINTVDFREFTKDKHNKVDDTPYGGGPGMVLMAQPIYDALKKTKSKSKKIKSKVIMLAPNGKTFNQKMAKDLSKYDQIIFLCGRYEGFDARLEKYVDQKVSIGDYVLSGGELPALVMIEAISRHIPGVLGNAETLEEESFSLGEDYLEYPHYTRPEDFKGDKVPPVLLSGNHARIAEFRAKMSKKKK